MWIFWIFSGKCIPYWFCGWLCQDVSACLSWVLSMYWIQEMSVRAGKDLNRWGVQECVWARLFCIQDNKVWHKENKLVVELGTEHWVEMYHDFVTDWLDKDRWNHLQSCMISRNSIPNCAQLIVSVAVWRQLELENELSRAKTSAMASNKKAPLLKPRVVAAYCCVFSGRK